METRLLQYLSLRSNVDSVFFEKDGSIGRQWESHWNLMKIREKVSKVIRINGKFMKVYIAAGLDKEES